ncbi:hypothetical protein N7509_012498 [Penicillium cosmopolitanum]|uniref:Uncharacterized protein n=1 Tax=Penicillium cosmopolitanum TaxID=1131564 RepID=A0A9W9SKG7_9EURO|nr:uncharacterized protein N7509_012498 [Penicillium cosmopolitanum]KAJ5379379.1 hypothetical protein N7509_012498 [Penicillium cosmopolitanum]
MELLLDHRHPNNLVFRDEDYFDVTCQKLCHSVQRWVQRFSKHSDHSHCRALGELDEKMADRFENAVLDGSNVEAYLSDRVRRRDVFMSVTMTMVWEFIFTRYLFGMDRDQRQKLKSLEKQLAEVVPCSAVHRWRATSLKLQSQLPAFATQCQSEIEVVVLEIFGTLSHILPPSLEVEAQLIESLRKPEYDTNGDLVRQVYFTATLMNERSGETPSNEKLEEEKAVVRIVLFPLVIKRGDDAGEGDDEFVVCPAQVIVAPTGKDNQASEMTDGSCMSPDDQRSVHSTASSEAPPSPVMDTSNMI